MSSEIETIKSSRQKIHNLYGKNLAEKAGDAFCLAYGLLPDAFAFSGFAESFSMPSQPLVQTRAAVLEFAVQEAENNNVKESKRKMCEHKDWEKVQKAINKLAKNTDLIQSSSEFLRQSQLKKRRDDFSKICGGIRNEVERGARGFQPGAEATASPVTPSAVTEMCWLNQTMRTFVAPQLLAEIAADNKIEKIDLPRRLEAEMTATMKTIAAPDYRNKFNVKGKDIIVAVIDSEVALGHPALKDRVIQKKNYSNELWGNPGAHGTAVAGIIAADSPDYVGVAPAATIYNYKVLGTFTSVNADDFGGALAIQDALEDGAHIANCSWGAGKATDGKSRFARACNTAWENGLIIVKSAGNLGDTDDTMTTPADADGVIVVGATDLEGLSVQEYSSRGMTQNGKRPHFLAPGGVAGVGLEGALVGGGFGACGWGTSFAAPHVAGMLALLLEKDLDAAPDELRATLESCCAAFNPSDEKAHGKGLVSLASLLNQ